MILYIGYVLLYTLFFPIIVLVYLLIPKIRSGFRNRLVLFSAAEKAFIRANQWILFHGASSGDIQSLLPLINKVREHFKTHQIAVMTMTRSGRELIKKRFPDRVLALYMPFDLPWLTSKFMALFAPTLVILEYTELWPALIQAAHKKGAKIVLNNGRISKRSISRYLLIRPLIKRCLTMFSLLLMRSEEDKARILKLGARQEIVQVTGNTKYDLLDYLPQGNETEWRQKLFLKAADMVWVCGSTHQGEERLLLPIYQEIQSKHPQLKLVLCPRYTHRVPEIQALFQEAGLKAILKSELQSEADVILVDTVGELNQIYSIADFVFVGGSFVDRGGQNILEPAFYKKLVFFGPSLYNFQFEADVLKGHGGICAQTPAQLLDKLQFYLARPEEMKRLGELAFTAVSPIKGAAARNFEAILKLLEGP